jgi:hypothetical protein
LYIFPMTILKSPILLLALIVTAVCAQECLISINQQQRTMWSSDEGKYALYDVQLQNIGSVDISALVLGIEEELEAFWEVLQIEGTTTYTLPEWRSSVGGIAISGYHQFGYILKANAPAEISVVACVPADGTVIAPTDAPEEQPTQPPEQPTEAPVEPTEAPAEPTEAPAEPTDAPVEPTDAPVEPTDAPAEPTDAPVEPTDAPVEPTEAPVEPTEAPVEPTEAPVEPTEAPVEPTEAPAEPTEAPAEPTAAPTEEPAEPTKAPIPATKEPTRKPRATKRPTNPPSEATTAPPTEVSPTKPDDTTTSPTTPPTTTKPATATTKPTTTTTTKPTTTKAATTAPSTGGRVCGSGTWWQPAPLTTYQWQLTGTVDTSVDVQMYDIDLFDASTSLISKLHADGRVVVCYFSTQYEDWRPDASSFPSSGLGNDLDDWEGEKYIDIRSSAIRAVMQARLDLAASKGCDGVEPDNVDGYTASSGFPLKAADQLDFNKFLASEAHARGLSIGLKNDLDQAAALVPYFDWALNEQCYQYSECSMLSVFVNAGKAVFNTEYSGSASTICPYMNNLKFTSLIKSLDLSAKITANCCTYRAEGCAGVTYVCGSTSSALLAETTKESEPIALSQIADSSSTITYSAMLIIAAIICGLILA